MTTRLRTLVDHLRKEALAPYQQRTFDSARGRQPTLGEHADVASVLRKLSDDREHTYPEREALTRAMLTEHQTGGGELWGSVLVVAYYPMLSRLRHRIVGDTVARDDLDQLVLTSFMAALRDVPARIDRLALRLRQRTQRLVFRFIRRERAERHSGCDIDDLGGEGLAIPAMSVQPVEQERREKLAKVLVRVAEGELPPDSLQIILSTVVGHERLRAYVGRTVEGDDVTRERVYQRLKRKRTRALKRIRKLLAESPIAQSHGF